MLLKKKAKTVYNVYFLDKDEEVIDQTQVDEKKAKLAWDLFKEFGHTRTKGMKLEWEETTED